MEQFYIYIYYIYIYLIQAVTTTLDKHREKIQVWLRNEKYLVILYNYGIKKTFEKKVLRRSDIDNGNFQQQSPKRLIDGYEQMNSWNKRWLMRLKLIQEEYYSIGNQKSYSS